MIHENCEGCASLVNGICSLYARDRQHSNDISLNAIKNCPCSICIIKPMCLKYCRDYADHVYKYERTYDFQS